MARMKKRHFHTFKRIDPDAEKGDPPIKYKALVKPATEVAVIRLTESHIQAALDWQGQADSQNCAGSFCVRKHKRSFNHGVMDLVDWWDNRVFIAERVTRDGKLICRNYAHYDNVAELFDSGPKALNRLLQRVRKEGYIEITLYPVRRGRHSKTGVPTAPSGKRPSGVEREARLSGSELRVMRHLRAFANVG